MTDNADELIDYEEEEEQVQVPTTNKRKAVATPAVKPATKEVKKGSYVGIHSTGFRDFFLKPELLRAIVDCGFEHPSEVQQECIPQAILGMDVLCQAKSGMGKTAVFVLATLQQVEPVAGEASVIVLCHTRELAFQIKNEYARFSKYMPEIKTAVFFGGISIKENYEVLKNETPQIIVGTPGRILALIRDKSLNLSKIKHFVLDECDKMLDTLDMRRDVQDIFRQTPHDKQVMMFTATLSKEIRPICKKFMQNPLEIYVDDEAKLTLHGLQQHYVKLQENEKNKKLNDLLDSLEFNQVVIFVKSVARANELSKLLVECNFPSICFHSGMSQEERISRYKSFKEFKHRIMVSTDVFGRGIDIERVNIVINYDMPENADSYLHRVGRAGRFGTKGLAITFVSSAEDSQILNQVQERFEVNITELPDKIDIASYNMRPATASPTKSNLKRPDYRVIDDGSKKPVQTDSDDYSHSILVREPTLAKSSTLSRKESFKKTPQTLSDPKDSVRFQNFDVEEQESSNMKDEHGDFSSSDPDVSIPGYSYNPNSVNDNLPESPSFPRSRFRSAFPVRGAFNHIGFLKHQNYMLSNKGFVTKRLEKIMKTKSLKNLTEIDDAPLSRNSNGKLAGVTTRSENNISNVGKKGGSPNFSLTRGNSSSKGPAGGPLFEITKKKSRLAYRDKLIKDLQDIQRKLNVLEDRASQMQEDQNNPQGEVDEVVLSTNMIQITEDILEALVSINQRLETLDPSKMAKQSFEGIIRPIMTLLKVAPYNLEILKESATMFMKMSILNEESWAHMFQLKALQHFVDAMIHVKVDDNAVRRRKGGSRSSGNMPITRSLSSSSNNNNPVSNQPSAQSLTATASKVIATMRASMHNSSRQSVMASQGFSRPSLQVSDTQRPSQLGKSLTNIASSMSAILQSNDALGSDNRSSHGMTKGSIMNIISTNTTTPKPRRGSIMNPVNFMNKMMETSNSKFGDLFFTEDNLLSGLLKMYLESNFMDRLEDMGKEERIETIKNLLLSFRKVGKLLSAANYISVELNMNNALEKVLSESCNIIESDKGILWFVDKTTFELRPLSTSSSPRPFEVIPRAVGIAGQVVISKEVIVEENASKSPYFDERVDTYPGKKTRNILAVPIVNKAGQVEAVLELINKKNDQSFTDEDIFLIKHMAIHSGIIIENAKSYDTIRRTQKKVEVLLGTTRSLSSELELEKLIQAIMQAARELLNCDRCTLFLIDREKNELWSQVQGREGLQNIRFPVGVGIAGHVAQTGALVNIADAYKDPRFNPEIDKRTGYKTHSILCMPLKNISGQIIGVTQMINKLSGEFGSDDEQLLAAFSAQAAVAIEKSYLFKKTEEMRNHLENILRSITDSVLTISEQGLMALGKTDEELRSTNYTLWLGENNPTFAKDVETVFKTHEMIHCTEYDLKTQSNTVTTVNYSVMPLVGGSSGGVVLVLEDLSREKRIMNTLGRYMAPELAKQVLAGGSQLGGTRQKVSIFFSDIRSFTKISEAMQPHEVVELLNRHFEDAVNAIQAEQGVLDKFIGDCVMAVFGVPFVRPDDAIHACNCALRIMKGLAIMNMEREKQGQLQIKIGVGINTGEVLSGNIGSEKRMEYTVIGDNVNLASRVEGLTKYYGVEILITESTKEEVGENFLLREIDTVVVVGKSTGISLYELIGSADYVIDNSRKKCHGIFKTALAEYRKRNFIKAKELFERANDVFPDDKASLVFRDRCQEYIESPPPEDWNGIYVSDHK